ncbi:MAG: hypothetical protein LBH59_05050 [Planctomycetaceae bacterium]|jgi:adenine-specific DNA-methyltransferase|nr:hypothetical protein [Planctomycetaceae bacterium]
MTKQNSKKSKTFNGDLKSIINYNNSAKPNSELLNTLKFAIPQFFEKDTYDENGNLVKNGDFKIDKFLDELQTNNIVESYDGYKLNFVGKDYARLQTSRKPETLIAPDTKHNSQKENQHSNNIFITGDNLEALRHLQNAYAGKIKMIYIDPPYNTGKEFVYSDSSEFTTEQLKLLLGYNNNEITRLKSLQGKSTHSAWLTFMYSRLKLAQKLLTNDGVIFVSIDDNEQANLKLLMNDIFGEGNFIVEIIRKTKSMTGDENTGINIQHENLICFARNKPDVFFNGEKKEYNCYKNPDNDPNGDWISGDPSAKNGSNATYFSIKNPLTGKEDYPPNGRFWAFSKTTCNKYIKTGKIKFKKHHKKNERGFIFKRYKNDLENQYNPVNSLFAIDNKYMNSQGTTELFSLMGKNLFDNPKPTLLIQKLIAYSTSKADFILDFFAGSGTTAQAVLQQNADDNGNRKFILIQLDEQTKINSEAQKIGYKTIDEITRERIKLATKKIKIENDAKLSKDFDGGFRHYRLVVPDVATLDKIKKFDPENKKLFETEMIDQFAYKNTKTSGIETLLTTWLINDGCTFDTEIELKKLAHYESYYVKKSATLYLINRDWNTKALQVLLNEIHENKLSVNTIIVYAYSFGFESMHELKTNIKNNISYPPKIIERY